MGSSQQNPQPYLDIRNAEVYNGQERVFTQLNLQICRGEQVAVLGPNGAGKTTLLKLLTRELYPVVRPDSHVKLFGEERVQLWELRQKIGLVSQDFQNSFLPIVEGLDVVLSGFFGAEGVRAHHQVTQAQHNRALQLLQELGIEHLAQRRYVHLSTGQQRRLLLARALVHRAQMLVFDEPTNGLDIKAAFQWLSTVRGLAKAGTSLLLVTHHVSEIVPEIERVVFLKGGRVVADGSKHALLTSKNLSELFDVPVRIGREAGFYSVVPG